MLYAKIYSNKDGETFDITQSDVYKVVLSNSEQIIRVFSNNVASIEVTDGKVELCNSETDKILAFYEVK